jgi:hypothetical protein
MELRQYVFERLNTGGERLNPQEIRNCLYAGEFNNMLISIARDALFTSIWEIPPKESGEPRQVSRKLERNTLYSKMADCEIVLRYFALTDLSNFKSGMKKTLDHRMIDNKPLTKDECDRMKVEYLSVLKTAQDIYGASLFRLPKNGNGLTGRRSVPLADAILIAIESLMKKKDKMVQNKAAILAATKKTLQDPDQYEILVGRGNTKKLTEDRLELMKEIIGKAIK